MKYPKTLALALLLTLSSINFASAQSEEEDPLAGIDELFNAIEEIESAEEAMEEGFTETESTELVNPGENTVGLPEADVESETTETLDEQISTTEEDSVTEAVEAQSKNIQNRLLPKEVPEGKEDHVLYTVPGAIDYRGMTFLKIDSPRFFNRFQKCNTTEAEKTYNALAKLKISQGSPLECREAMQYQFMPYRTFRASR